MVMANICGVLPCPRPWAKQFIFSISYICHSMVWWLPFLHFLSKNTKSSPGKLRQLDSLNNCSTNILACHRRLKGCISPARWIGLCLRTCTRTGEAGLEMHRHRVAFPLEHVSLQQQNSGTQAHFHIMHAHCVPCTEVAQSQHLTPSLTAVLSYKGRVEAS